MKFLNTTFLCVVFLVTACDKKNIDDIHSQYTNTTAVKISPDKAPTSTSSDLGNSSDPALTARALKLVDEHGLDSLALIYAQFSGKDRDAAVTAAITVLSYKYDVKELLSILGALPPGHIKAKWLTQVINNHGKDPEISNELFAIVDKMEFLEDRRTVAQELAYRFMAHTSDELDRTLSFVSSHLNYDPQMMKTLSRQIAERYAYNIASSLAWKNDIFPADIPQDYRKDAVIIASNEFAQRNYSQLIDFANQINKVSPDLSGLPYLAAFSLFAHSDPEKATIKLESIPSEQRAFALEGLMKVWVTEDAQRASEWATSLTNPDDKSIAADAIVKYLLEKGGSNEEIEEWSKLKKKD